MTSVLVSVVSSVSVDMVDSAVEVSSVSEDPVESVSKVSSEISVIVESSVSRGTKY